MRDAFHRQARPAFAYGPSGPLRCHEFLRWIRAIRIDTGVGPASCLFMPTTHRQAEAPNSNGWAHDLDTSFVVAMYTFYTLS